MTNQPLDLEAVKARQQEVRDAMRCPHGPEWKFNLQKAILLSSEDVPALIAEVERLREDRDRAFRQAADLAKTLHQKHYTHDAPNWHHLDTVTGVISQINNMTGALTLKTQEAE